MINNIKIWLKALILKQPVPMHIVDLVHPFLEDGMNFEQYVQYEKKQFDSLSKIFDLNEYFDINVLAIKKYPNQKNYIFFYIINSSGKIVCKMTMTLNAENLITGNDFHAQIVPKFIIHDGKITGLGVAINTFNSQCQFLHMSSTQLTLLASEQGLNYEHDNFHCVQFLADDITLNSWYKLNVVLSLDNKKILEKRDIYFDNFNADMKPYLYNQDKKILSLLDNTYPVHLALYYQDRMDNYEYPRLLTLSTQSLKYFIATDCLDNDWHETLS